jgi:mutator protein MutT
MRIDCVGAIVHDEGRLLLVRRANPPAVGTWTIPGGKVEPGEDDAAAVVREVAEETGLVVEVGRLVGQVERDAPGGAVFVIRDYECRLTQGGAADAVAADDADAVTWVDLDGLGQLPLAPLLRESLEEWGVLPTA